MEWLGGETGHRQVLRSEKLNGETMQIAGNGESRERSLDKRAMRAGKIVILRLYSMLLLSYVRILGHTTKVDNWNQSYVCPAPMSIQFARMHRFGSIAMVLYVHLHIRQ